MPELLRAIQWMGYKLPTPIQRKCIPVILDGHDMIGMARTGSGKSAAFLIPLIALLKRHSVKVGCRALLLSPTRELALQTSRFAKQISRYTDLRICIVVGGEAVDAQFDGLSYNPDLIVATPGRLSYLLKEIQTFNLRHLKYLICDEADRLFEMGFAVQLKVILDSLSKITKTQKMLFSATMPRTVMQFSRATLVNPVIIRLDTDIKISPNLQLSYLYCRHDDKLPLLLYLLKHAVEHNKMVLLFAATRYHVELLQEFLRCNDIDCVSCFGSMEQEYRNENIEKFRRQEINIMIVTDLASRGIDIPLLDYVINFQMPTSAKSFVHRVGRVARNGKMGTALSMVEHNELPYVSDVFTFLGHTLPLQTDDSDKPHSQATFGMVPSQTLLSFMQGVIDNFRKNDELAKLQKIADNSMDIYERTKLKPSKHGIRMAKDIDCRVLHPLFADKMGAQQLQTLQMLHNVASFKPHSSVFEIGGAANPGYAMMQNTRSRFDTNKNDVESKTKTKTNQTKMSASEKRKQAQSVIDRYRDSEYFIDTQSKENGAEGFVDDVLQINSHEDKLKQFVLELDEDERSTINTKKKLYRYNPNTRKYVTEFMGDRMLRYFKEKNEANKNVNAAQHKYGRLYEEWKLKSKREIAINGSFENYKEIKTDNTFIKNLGLKRRHQQKNEQFEKQRMQKRLHAINEEKQGKETRQKDKMKKFKRDKFKKWWSKNKDRVKQRQSKRRTRGY